MLTYLVYYITNTMLSILFFWLPGFLSGWTGINTSSWLDSYGLVILVLKYLVIALYQVMVILHYGNLVEIKDETGIKQQIDSI
ncbi:MAG: hypothetical protein IT236_14500 [Bacteroidia bacterium]|nr:hypothetical protein [Bacteroidia bacterium]